MIIEIFSKSLNLSLLYHFDLDLRSRDPDLKGFFGLFIYVSMMFGDSRLRGTSAKKLEAKCEG